MLQYKLCANLHLLVEWSMFMHGLYKGMLFVLSCIITPGNAKLNVGKPYNFIWMKPLQKHAFFLGHF